MKNCASLFEPADSQRCIGVMGEDAPLARFVETADTFFARFVGLQFRLPLRRGHGLLLYPAKGIHTFWMRGAIDVLWLDRNGIVVRVAETLPPWRVRMATTDTFAVLELGAGTVSQFGNPLVNRQLVVLK